MENNLDGSGYGNQSSQSKGVSAWPFVLGAAFVAALIALVVVKVSIRVGRSAALFQHAAIETHPMPLVSIFRRSASRRARKATPSRDRSRSE